MPAGQRFLIISADLIHRVKNAVLRIDAEPPARERIQRLPVAARQRQLAHIVEAVSPDFHIAAAGHFRVQLPNGAGAGIARVGVQRFAVAFPFRIHLPKTLQGQIHFAPRLQAGRRPRRQPVRDAGNGAQVVRNILPGLPVAPRCPQRQPPVGIHQTHCQPVNLQLRHHPKRPPVQQVANPAMPRLQPFPVKSVGQAQHRDRMLHLRKAVRRAAAHPLRRRVGGATFRVCRLQLPQLLHQRVIPAVADNGRIPVKILLVVKPQFLPQPPRAFRRPAVITRSGRYSGHPCHPRQMGLGQMMLAASIAPAPRPLHQQPPAYLPRLHRTRPG